MTGPAWRFRAAALIAAGSLAVHELRYLLAYGDESGQAAASQGHAYLASVTTIVAALLVVVIAACIARVASGARASAASVPSPWRVWAAASGTVLLVFVLQEWVEGQVAPGHAAGLEGVFAHGGWLAIPLAAAIGALIALALRGAATSAAPAQAWAPTMRSPGDAVAGRLLLACSEARTDPVACHLAGRGPPPALV